MNIYNSPLSNISVALNETVLRANIVDEAVMLNTETNYYFSLDPIGTHMLHLIETLPSLADVHADMLTEFEVSAEKLAADLRYLVTELQSENLVTVEIR